MDAKKYRHEFKYLISDNELLQLYNRIKTVMDKDSHVGERGSYNISSLYYDDIYNTCFYENENGTDPREKFRIRIYNHDTKHISLECKRKERGKTLKTSCPLTYEQTKILVHGGYLKQTDSLPPILRKFTYQIMTYKLRPKVIVEYDRIPFVYSNGNVRITFDKYLTSSMDTDSFLTGAIRKRPVMPNGLYLLEVKYDEYLPDFIYKTLQLDNLTQTSHSKYYLCRKYCL